MKKAIFIVDVRDWAYDYRAKHWKELLKDEFEIDIIYLSEFPIGNFRPNYMMSNRYFLSKLNNSSCSIDLDKVVKEDLYYYTTPGDRTPKPLKPLFDHNEYDAFLFFYSKALSDKRLLSTFIPFEKTIICINNEKWKDFGSNVLYWNYLQGVNTIACCNDNIVEEFKKYSNNIMKLTQCAPDEFLVEEKDLIERHKSRYSSCVVGFSGNPTNTLKNFKNIQKACSSLGLELKVAKYFDQNDLRKWYKEVDLIVCASTSEGGPMCILEAGASGVPVITTDVGLAREIINNDNGLKIKSSSPSDIAEAIKDAFKNRDLTVQRAINLHKCIKDNWTYSSKLHEIRQILNKVCND
jgi:glycosyltransferase involved in cell wall biosynthesis